MHSNLGPKNGYCCCSFGSADSEVLAKESFESNSWAILRNIIKIETIDTYNIDDIYQTSK